MIVADSSYVVDSLLGGADEFRGEQMVVPDFAVAEVVNAFYVQDAVLHLIEDGRPYIERFFGIVATDGIRVVSCTEELMSEAYDIASRQKGAAYDCIFVALAIASGLELMTKDRRQAGLMEAEIADRERRQGWEADKQS